MFYLAKSNYYYDSNRLLVGKTKQQTAGVANEEFVILKPKMYSLLVDNSSEYKKAKGVSKNVAATISHNEYKNVLFNKKYLRYSMSRIQRKVHKIATYEINKFPCLAFIAKYIS